MASIQILVLLSLLGIAASTTTDATTATVVATTGTAAGTTGTVAGTTATAAGTTATAAGTTGTATTGTATTGTATTGTAITGTSTAASTTGWTTGAPTTYAVGTTASNITTANTATIKNQKVKIGKTIFKCNFFLVFTDDIVNVTSSTVSCNKKSSKTGKVTLTTPEGFIFSAVIKPPKTIVKLVGGDLFEADYKNVTTESKRQYSPHCGGYDGEIEGKRNRGYTTTDVKLWPNAEVNWAFVSTGDAYKKYSILTDAKIGYTEAEMKMIMKSMKRIEDKTCIRFKRVNPQKGKPWMLVMREAQVKNGAATCYRSYINTKLKNKEIGSAGKIFESGYWDGSCFSGAYVDGLGYNTPVRTVVSSTTLEDNENTVGLLVHELLHALGVGHTQKRPDRDTYITVNWNNIGAGGKGQYEKCTGNTCQTHNTEYDCSSIMHYMDTDFANQNGKTMTAKDANKCKFAYNTKLTDSDVTLLKKMYCDKTNKNLVTSPNYPKEYSASQDKQTPIKVADGSIIEILFTDFTLETESDCNTADWVQVVDGDGTELLKKSCGTTKPGKITSKTNSVTIKFHSDSTKQYKGFRAEWKAVKKLTAVDGKWSAWANWGTCNNNKDGKTACIKQRYRYCNNPAKSNGGKDCEGSSTEKATCTAADMTDASKHPSCVILGGWAAYGAGSKCNSECKSTKTRTCTNPAPINSKVCDGASSETSACAGGECTTATTGSIKSPNYPSNYPNKKDLKYPIKVESGSRIELTFVDFAIEAESSCSYDYVQVLDSDGSQLIKKCGSTKPAVVISKSNTMTLNFHSDDAIAAKGFSATWKKISSTESGTIKSTNYPKNYPDNHDVEYTISVADGSKVQLAFTDFQVEAEAKCGYDYVHLFDTNGKSIQKLCGSGSLSPITSTGNKMTVKFHSDYYGNMKGFSATWKKV